MTKGEQSKDRWNSCRIISHNMGDATHIEIHSIYSAIQASGLLDLVIQNNESAKSDIRALPEWRAMMQKRSHMPKIAEEPEEEERPRYSGKGFNKKPETNTEKLKLAFWFIDKFDTPADALKILQAAVNAAKELES